MFGTLHEADGCLWLVLEGSDQEVRIVWPNGYGAHHEPFAVLTPADDGWPHPVT